MLCQVVINNEMESETGVYASATTATDWMGIWDLDGFDEDNTELPPGPPLPSLLANLFQQAAAPGDMWSVPLVGCNAPVWVHMGPSITWRVIPAKVRS